MNEITLFTKNDRETRKVAGILAKECLGVSGRKQALILGLVGDLGGGKTTFTSGFAEALGIKERVTSPTFVLMKIFKLAPRKKFKHLVHIDAYRFDSVRELHALNWEEFVNNPKNIIVVEWADRVKRALPQDALIIKFKYIDDGAREIKITQNAGTKK